MMASSRPKGLLFPKGSNEKGKKWKLFLSICKSPTYFCKMIIDYILYLQKSTCSHIWVELSLKVWGRGERY
jgi:hypothetical protein